MSLTHTAILVTLATTIVAPAPAWAFGAGGGGCTNLPEYYRAVGVLQGMPSACDMSVEEARRIVYGSAAAAPVAAPAPRHRRHRVRPVQPY